MAQGCPVFAADHVRSGTWTTSGPAARGVSADESVCKGDGDLVQAECREDIVCMRRKIERRWCRIRRIKLRIER